MYSLPWGVFVTSCNFPTNKKTENERQQNVEITQREQPQENLKKEVLKHIFIGKYKIVGEYGAILKQRCDERCDCRCVHIEV